MSSGLGRGDEALSRVAGFFPKSSAVRTRRRLRRLSRCSNAQHGGAVTPKNCCPFPACQIASFFRSSVPFYARACPVDILPKPATSTNALRYRTAFPLILTRTTCGWNMRKVGENRDILHRPPMQTNVLQRWWGTAPGRNRTFCAKWPE